MNAPPFPTEILCSELSLERANATVSGACWLLATAYWAGGCRPLPDAEAHLAILARCHSAQWYRIRNPVKVVLSTLLPTLAAVYPERHCAWLAKQGKARRAGLASAAARRLQVRRISVGNELSSDGRNAGALLGAGANISRETPSVVRPRVGFGLLTDR